jgi:ribosomal protein S18 acetylase RimI-like enzyme
MNEITIRQTSDIEELMQWRIEVLHCVFDIPADADTSSLARENRKYYLQHLSDGTHVCCIASLGGLQAGCGGVCYHDEMPSPDNPDGHCAYLMNIYVRPEFRNRGVARNIVRWLVGDALGRGIRKIYLESSESAYPVYKSLGFNDMQNLMIYSPKES